METNRFLETQQMVAKFKNGEARYHQSALFNRVVQMLVRGESPYEVIDQLIYTTEDTMAALRDFMDRCTHPYPLNDTQISVKHSR